MLQIQCAERSEPYLAGQRRERQPHHTPTENAGHLEIGVSNSLV
jgi:hypothetical protein